MFSFFLERVVRNECSTTQKFGRFKTVLMSPKKVIGFKCAPFIQNSTDHYIKYYSCHSDSSSTVFLLSLILNVEATFSQSYIYIGTEWCQLRYLRLPLKRYSIKSISDVSTHR